MRCEVATIIQFYQKENKNHIQKTQIIQSTGPSPNMYSIYKPKEYLPSGRGWGLERKKQKEEKW